MFGALHERVEKSYLMWICESVLKNVETFMKTYAGTTFPLYVSVVK